MKKYKMILVIVVFLLLLLNIVSVNATETMELEETPNVIVKVDDNDNYLQKIAVLVVGYLIIPGTILSIIGYLVFGVLSGIDRSKEKEKKQSEEKENKGDKLKTNNKDSVESDKEVLEKEIKVKRGK